MRIDLDECQHQKYLGDGLYAGFDGWHVVLSNGSGKEYLEPEVIEAFELYLTQHEERMKGVKNEQTEENNTNG